MARLFALRADQRHWFVLQRTRLLRSDDQGDLGAVRRRACGNVRDGRDDVVESRAAAVAEAAGGRFFRAATLDELREVYAEIATIEATDSETPPLAQRRDLRALPLFVLLTALLALGFPAIGRRRPA